MAAEEKILQASGSVPSASIMNFLSKNKTLKKFFNNSLVRGYSPGAITAFLATQFTGRGLTEGEEAQMRPDEVANWHGRRLEDMPGNILKGIGKSAALAYGTTRLPAVLKGAVGAGGAAMGAEEASPDQGMTEATEEAQFDRPLTDFEMIQQNFPSLYGAIMSMIKEKKSPSGIEKYLSTHPEHGESVAQVANIARKPLSQILLEKFGSKRQQATSPLSRESLMAQQRMSEAKQMGRSALDA